MHGSGSTDPILRRIEQDMAATPTSSHASGPMGGGSSGGGSLAGTPQNAPSSPAASITSFFSRAMSFTGTPTSIHPPNLRPNRPTRPFGTMLGSSGGRGRLGGLPRQRSLESSDSGLSPGGTSYVSGPMGRLGGGGASHRLIGPGGSRLMRHHSEGGDDTGSLIMSEGEATPTLMSPSTYPSRFRPPPYRTALPGRRGYLSRGRSFGDPVSPIMAGGTPSSSGHSLSHMPTSASFHNRPVTSQLSTPVSLRSGGIHQPTTAQSTYAQASDVSISTSGGRGLRQLSHDSGGEQLLIAGMPMMESVSAPEDAAFGSDSGLAGGGVRDLYPRVLVSDSEARDVCPPLKQQTGDRTSIGRLLDPRTAGGHASSSSGASGSRRKLDATFRNDSLSSDQSECLQQQRPPPPKPHKHRKHGLHPGGPAHRHHHRHAHHSGGSGRPFMISSSDEDVRSTPECTSCGEEEMESESVSEKGRR